MSDGQQNQESQVTSDERELDRLEEEEDRLVASPHHGFVDASRVKRLEEEIQDADTKIRHEREE